jgi:type IV pilus assembly protein PilQ
MQGFRSGRFQIAVAVSFAVLLAVGTAGCAGSGSATASATGQGVSDVQIDHDGTDTIVMLMGPDHPVFTAFGQANPDRIIVDLSSSAAHAIEPIVVNDGLVAEVSVSPYSTGTGDEMTRVEVLLEAPADHEVIAVSGGLQVRISADSDAAAFDTSADWADETQAESFDPWKTDEAEGATDLVDGASEPTPATEFNGLDVEETSDGALLRLRANGLISSVMTFTLDDPARLVIDLLELKNAADLSTMELDSELVSRIRLGEHADKIRVVLDGGSASEPFDGRRLVPTPTGLIVALGRGVEIDEALAMATEISTVVSTPIEPTEAQETDVADSWPAESDAADEMVSDAADEMAANAADEMVSEAADEMAANAADEMVSDAADEMAANAADEMVSDAADEMVANAADETSDDAAAEAVADADGVTETEADSTATEIAQSDIETDSMATWVDPVDPVDAPVEELAAWETESDSSADSEMDSSLAAIYGIEFDGQDNRDRIVVLGDAPVEYKLFEPTAETVIISLIKAKIDPEAAVRITPEPGGPVSLVTAFDQPDMEEPEVRLVVQRAANLEPEISRRGSLLIIDFPHTGGMAVAPPAMTQDQAMGAQAELGGVPASISSAADVDDSQWASAGQDPESTPASLESESSIDLLSPGGLSVDKQYKGRRISLDFKDVDIADVLRLIAEVSELNVIAGDEVKGTVTVRLVDVPWDQALDVVLLTKGLGFMRIGNILRIAPSVEIQQEEEMRLQERRSKERLEDLIVKLQPVNYADVAEVAKMVGQLLTPDRGTVTTDKRTSTLIIKDIPSVIAEATALIKAIDTQTPQVMIEAKIVEANLDFSREFGSVWGLGADPNKMPDNWFYTPTSGPDAFSLNPITANPTGLMNLTGWLLDDTFNVDLQLQAAEVNGDGKVISSPRVVTLDNSKASIEQGVSIPFQTFENGDAQLEFVDAVLKLDVTPHITSNKSIIMKISVKRNAPDDSVFTLTGSPAIAKNQVKTETLVKDGQTLVLGGIYVIGKSERQSGVPYLNKIPLLGAMFRNDEVSDNRKELLIFVTPRIVMPEEDDV